ncbi:MAG: antitoxin VbhA family protein [Bacteroidales bacterium]|nr:antitoxin VbhA family protein [Bacteroidales bacterium]
MKDGYLDFDEYIVASEPHKRERAEAWKVAIGLQAVDGLQVSDYLLELARRNIEGEITIDEVIELLNERDAKKSRLNEYTSYTRIEAVDPIESKMGRPI